MHSALPRMSTTCRCFSVCQTVMLNGWCWHRAIRSWHEVWSPRGRAGCCALQALTNRFKTSCTCTWICTATGGSLRWVAAYRKQFLARIGNALNEQSTVWSRWGDPVFWWWYCELTSGVRCSYAQPTARQYHGIPTTVSGSIAAAAGDDGELWSGYGHTNTSGAARRCWWPDW